MNILSALLKKYRKQAYVAEAFGVERNVAHLWFKKKSVPVDRWDRVIELLPETTIDDCYAEFVRKQSGPTERANKRH